MSWFFYALLLSFFNATYVQMNRHFRVEGLRLVFIQSVFAVLFLLPFVANLEWPEKESFYILVFSAAVLSIFTSMLLFRASAKFGGRLTSLYLSIKVLAGFVVWSLIDPASFLALLEDFYTLPGVVFCLLLSILTTFFMRRNDASWAALQAVIPVGVLYTAMDVFSKIAMKDIPPLAGAIVFAFVMFVAIVPLSGGLMLSKKMKFHFRYEELIAGAVMAVLFSVVVILFTASNALSPNPAYVNAVTLLGIVWIMIYNKVRKIHDEAGLWSALGFVIAAAGLSLLIAK